MQGPSGGRRDLLRGAAALLADALLPRGAAAQEARERPKPERRAIVVTFGGGVRWEETFAPEGWPNIPHLVSDLVPQGLFYPEARYEGLTGHFNATGALVTGCLQNVDAYGGEAPTTPTVFECFRKQRGLAPEEAWVVASNKSFGLLGGSKLRDYGDPWSANVILPKQFLVETIKSAVSTAAASGDELTFFMTKEIMSRLAPSLLVVNFWDVDIAHFGAYSLHLEAIRRTDRLVHGLWQHAQSLPQYRERTTLIVAPEMGRDGDASGNGFQNHRSGDDSCRRLWLLALGPGIPRGLISERPIRTTDVAPTLGRVLGFTLPPGEGQALRELAY